MAKSGDRFEMVDGSVYAVLKTAGETGGEFVEMEFQLPPGAVPPPAHIHSRLVEEYEVLEGRFEVMVDGTYIEHIYKLLSARGVQRKTDPRVPTYLSMLMLEYSDTLVPGRKRERFGLRALAGLGRLFGMRTAV